MNQLVIQLARMGDLLQTKRLLLSLAQEGDVHLLVDHSLVSFASYLYPFAIIHGISAHAGGLEPAKLLSKVLPQLAELAKYKFQVVYNLNFSGLNLALSTFWSPKIMHGHWLEAGQAFKSSWLDLAFRWSRERNTAPLNLMDLWGLLAPKSIEPHKVNPSATPKGGGIGVMLAGRMARRSLPPEYLTRAITAVCQRMESPEVYLLGTEQEQAVGREVMRGLSTKVLNKTKNMAGSTSLCELAKQISKLDCLLTPDTGGMHLAAHLGVPVEAFFLSSAWVYETGPYGEGHRAWQAIQPCSPCLESKPCPYEVKCLNPFKENTFLNVLSKPEGSKILPQGLLGLESSFDNLGVTYKSMFPEEVNFISCSSDNNKRADLRQLLEEYSFDKLDYEKEQIRLVPAKQASTLYKQVFRESDWMLPKRD